jgi:hypothetical protein
MAIIAMPIADLKRARGTAQNVSTVAPTQAVAPAQQQARPTSTPQNVAQQTKPATATPPRAIRMRPAQQEGGTDIRRVITMIMSLMGTMIGLYTVVYAMQIIYSVPPAQLAGTPVAFSLG